MRVITLIVILAAATAVLGQDPDSKFKDWIDKLGDSDFELREKAQEALIQIGEPAIPALKAAMKSGDAEVAQRARDILAAIEKNRVVRTAIKKGTRLTLSLDEATAQKVAETIGRITGLEIRLPEAIQTKRLKMAFRDAELLRVLDEVARQTGKAYRVEGEKTVVFTDDAFVEKPVAYSGPFKFRISTIRTTSENTFSKRKTDVDLTIAIEREPGVKPVEPAIRVLGITDKAGNKLEWRKEAELAGPVQSVSTMTVNGRTIKILSDGQNFRVVIEGQSGAGEKLVPLHDIKSAISSFGTVRAEAIFTVVSDKSRKIEFKAPAPGASQTVGELKITIEDTDEGWIEVVVRGKGKSKVPANLLNKDSLVIVSDGKEYESELMQEDDISDLAKGARDRRNLRRLLRRVRRMQRGLERKETRFLIRVPKKARAKGVESLSFSLKQVVRHRVEFKFKDVDLR